ncbi:MAG: glutamine--fructose-6-phosphate transaminase (isomerizing) [Methanomicrobiales archaeon]|nr:glutamine--fructose-6-phosphate transaminase (isomerizing) [Methanomicrobiales archaeon]
MCGIIGYIGHREAAPVLVGGLKALEYRGYDSFGLATMGGDIQILKKRGKISEGIHQVDALEGRIGIGHTRWATHGEPSDPNAHPHTDCHGRIAVVHNGIITNYAALKEELLARGHRFTSETDTEVIAHLMEEYGRGDSLAALRDSLRRLEGTYALLVMVSGEDRILAARQKSPLVLGLGDRETLAASDVVPLLEYTGKVVFLDDGDIAILAPDGVSIVSDGGPVTRPIERISWQREQARKGGYRHFMQKEIFEQPIAFFETLKSLDRSAILSLFRGRRELTILACGSSYHAGLVGRQLLEGMCRMPVRVELASEFRYSPIAMGNTAIAISQSGETADTIAALEHAEAMNCETIAITNVQGSSITRIADHVIFTRAGPEIGVAATKSYIAQLGVFMAIAASLAGDAETERALMGAHRALERALHQDYTQAAELCSGARSLFFIGRGLYYPAAMEGALKMKEISYIHAEAYAAGELKHGPLALLTPETPVVAICTCDDTREAMLSSMKEVKARGAPLIAIGEGKDPDPRNVADIFIPIPCTHAFHKLLQVTVVLQLLAYHTASLLGREIDQPRNLAKSVTVE